MQTPRFRAKRIPGFSKKLVIGTSRTKYIDPREAGATVHSFRGATLADLCDTLQYYAPKKLNCVTIIAGFNDNQVHPQQVSSLWKRLINLIINKFNPNHLLIPKTIATSNNRQINQRISVLNNVLFNVIAQFSHPYIRIISPALNLPANFFCRDGIHFSFYGNEVFAMLLSQMMCLIIFC